jgi:hypothetical protein
VSAYTKAERRERWGTCIKYLKLAGNVPAAQRMAAKQGVSFPTAVWVSALGKMLEAGAEPGRPKNPRRRRNVESTAGAVDNRPAAPPSE